MENLAARESWMCVCVCQLYRGRAIHCSGDKSLSLWYAFSLVLSSFSLKHSLLLFEFKYFLVILCETNQTNNRHSHTQTNLHGNNKTKTKNRVSYCRSIVSGHNIQVSVWHLTGCFNHNFYYFNKNNNNNNTNVCTCAMSNVSPAPHTHTTLSFHYQIQINCNFPDFIWLEEKKKKRNKQTEDTKKKKKTQPAHT